MYVRRGSLLHTSTPLLSQPMSSHIYIRWLLLYVALLLTIRKHTKRIAIIFSV